MQDTISLPDFFNTNGFIERESGITRGRYIVGSEFLYRLMETEELVTLDEKLPQVLDVMFDLVKVNSIPLLSIPTNWVRATLEHWRNPMLVQDVHGQYHNLMEVTAVLDCDEDAKEVTLGATGYDIHKTGNIDYVTHTHWVKPKVSFDELEKHYPAWHIRYSLLMSLHASVNEIQESVFKRQFMHAATATFPAVTFDE